MKICILACSIYQPELEAVLAQIRRDRLVAYDVVVTYLPLKLHSNLAHLKEAVINALAETVADRIILLYGSKCHPEFDEFLRSYRLVRFAQANCIELILGARSKPAADHGKTFFLTPGWLTKWRELFDTGTGIDEVALRQSFGFFDRVLFYDTGVSEITDEMILEFFDYTRVPIAVEQGNLAAFRTNILAAIQAAVLASEQPEQSRE